MIFVNADGKELALAMSEAIQKNKMYLSEIDGAIGDGDHGINMNKGFTAFAHKIADKNVNLTEALKILGETLLMDIGGSMGPLYGTFFLSMAAISDGHSEIDKDTFGRMLSGALAELKDIGNAKVGDKTLIDVLEPAAQAFNGSADQGKDFKTSLEAMKEAAEKGRDNTKELVAKIGRAARLGERSRGFIDAGAASCCLLLCAMADKMIVLMHV